LFGSFTPMVRKKTGGRAKEKRNARKVEKNSVRLGRKGREAEKGGEKRI